MDPPVEDDGPDAAADRLDRAVRIAAIVATLKACLHELDQLRQWRAAAHLSFIVSLIELDEPAPPHPGP